MGGFVQALQRFGIGRLAAILGVSAGVAVALVALVLNLGREPKALLFSGLDLKEAASITQALDQAGIEYDAKGDGSTIMVPRDKVASTRLMLSSKGLPTQGSVGYEIFDGSAVLGQTDFVQDLNKQRATQGELERTLRTLDGVQNVRVHLAMPKRQLFEDEAQAGQASASVVLTLAGRAPSGDQVRGVQNLVAAAVPGLKPEMVRVLDQHAKLLGGEGDSAADTRRTEVEDSVRRKVKELVESVVGVGKARVQVTADLDQSRVTVQKEEYDPDGQVVRSESTSEENAKESREESNQAATAANNIPGQTPTQPGFQPLGSQSGSNQSVTNYEITRTTRTEVTEPGAVKRLSIGVVVDGVTAPAGKDGKPGAYTPRSAQEMAALETLVKSAIGFDPNRQDQVKVTNLRFDPEVQAEGDAASKLLDFDKNDIMRFAELGVLGLVAVLLMLFVVRPMIKGPKGGAAAAGGVAGLTPALAGGPGGLQAALTVDPRTGETLALPAPGGVVGGLSPDAVHLEAGSRQGRARQVSDFADRHPEESVAILRSWLHGA